MDWNRVRDCIVVAAPAVATIFLCYFLLGSTRHRALRIGYLTAAFASQLLLLFLGCALAPNDPYGMLGTMVIVYAQLPILFCLTVRYQATKPKEDQNRAV